MYNACSVKSRDVRFTDMQAPATHSQYQYSDGDEPVRRREEQKMRCTNSAHEAETKWLSKSVRTSACGRERERETVVMIDARLPPLCSSEWLQQKAQNNIPDYQLCFSPSLASRLSHSLCVSAGGQRLHSQLCRGYAESETGLEARSRGAINKLGLVDHGIIARSSIIQLSRHHCSWKGKKK